MASSDDEDYDAHMYDDSGANQYPIHDACETGDILSLKRLIFEEEQPGQSVQDDGDGSSSSDDNDSTAAALAAAIGHSPQPRPDASIDQPGDATSMAINAAPPAKENDNPPAEPKENSGKGDSEHSPPDEKTDAPSIATPKDTSSSPNETQTTKVGPRLRVRPGISLNERDDDEITALHVAIHSRQLEHVKVLLEAGANYRLRNDGSYPLHTAISLGALKQHRQFSYECFVALTEAGADLTVKDDSNHTPLFLACMYNSPQIVSYILSQDEGLSTLNTRADRAGNRPLHVAAKFDTVSNATVSPTATANATGQAARVSITGTVTVPKSIPGFPGKLATTQAQQVTDGTDPEPITPVDSLVTQNLLGTNGIEIDALNSLGHSALHVACMRGNWSVARLLLQAGSDPAIADKRGFTPGQLAYKRGMPIPNDISTALGGPPESGVVPPPRDLIVDPDSSTVILSHELCMLHRTCPPMKRDGSEPPPENVRRLHVLVDGNEGILRGGEFARCTWEASSRRAAISDVLKVHEYQYVERISRLIASIPDVPNTTANLDGDTAISHWSFEAAMRAAGSVCQAVDQVIAGEHRNAFCAVRPPGHHAGPRGIVHCGADPEGGSHGFCLLNNVAIGAAYARSMYRNEGIKRVAIIDFDVHHGNGTEAIVRNLIPTEETAAIRTPFAYGSMSTTSYRPWLDETDLKNVFFASTHGYGARGFDQVGLFYPASGRTGISESIENPSMVEDPGLTDFLSSQTWARMNEDSKNNCCKIINFGLGLPEETGDIQGRSMKQRLELRDVYRKKVLPCLREFDPDLIFISAGFDAHRRDTMNFGYVGMVEEDYEWVTEQLVKVANTCCNGRVISVLEGGYKIHGGIISPFARSVASHVRALADGGRSRELYDPSDLDWESQHERHFYEKRERKKEEERERLRLMQQQATTSQNSLIEQLGEDVPDDPDAPSRKRRRNTVNYQELLKQMEQEGFANG